MNDIKSQIESILFVSSKPLPAKTLAKILNTSVESIHNAAAELMAERADKGVVVLQAGESYQMATNGANALVVKTFLNSDLREKLTDATVEVLAIIVYRQPISKAEIEAIRGVNSQYSLRQLLMRGLIEKNPNPGDARGNLYQITTEFLQHMGMRSARELPDFETLVKDIKLPEKEELKENLQEQAPKSPSA